MFQRINGTLRSSFCLLALVACFSSPLEAQTLPSVSYPELEKDAVNDALGLAASNMFSLNVVGDPGEPVKATIMLEGREFTLDLAPHSNRSALHYKVLVQGADGVMVDTPPTEVRTLRGVVEEIPGSLVAASYDESGGLYARINIEGEASSYWVEQVAMSLPGASTDVHVSYRGSDIVGDDSKCGVNSLPSEESGHFALGGGCPIGLCLAELACDSDVEYYNDYGSSVTTVENRINSIVNAMNLQYESQADVRHAITAIVVRTSEPDPYSSSDIGNLLTQLRSQWLGPMSGTPHDVAQLFTGRNISGGTIGLAYLGSVCTSQRYSVVENFTNNFGCLTDLSAHELGHNWGAGHCSCNNFTMNPSITCANQFTSGSIAAITGTKSTAGCLTPDGPPLANFNEFGTSGPAPLTVNFTDFSGGAITSWNWNFGDGGASTLVSPSHTYTTAGVYDVSLTVTGPSGSDTITKPNLVNVSPPLADFADLGGGSPGALFGVPELSVTSSLLAGESFSIQLVGVPPTTLTMVWLSFASTPVPAFNGVVHPFPPSQQLFFFASLFGVVNLNSTWPAGIAPGLDLFLQFFVQDASVVEGVTLSNGVKGTTP